MEKRRNRKWKISFALLSLVVLVLGVHQVFLYKQIGALKKEAVQNLTAEYDQVYRLAKIVNEHDIPTNFREAERYRLFVNQITHHSSTLLAKDLKNLLQLAYDPLFADVTSQQGALNPQEASVLLAQMNNAVMNISKKVLDMTEDEKEKLLDPTSQNFIATNASIQHTYVEYLERVDDYFRNNGSQ